MMGLKKWQFKVRNLNKMKQKSLNKKKKKSLTKKKSVEKNVAFEVRRI